MLKTSYASLIFVLIACSVSLAADPPNVILIMTDDQGYGDVGAHGNTMIRTPNLDQLSQESFQLTNFHVDPTCSETRSALMTGRYSCRTGVWHTIMGRSILRRDEITMADVFRANGYRTAMFGKWHLGDNYPYRPEHRGFEEVLAHGGGGVGQTPDVWDNDYFDDTYFRNGEHEPQEGYCTDVFFAAAESFIRRSKDSPFFCYIATNAPHGPFNVDDKYADIYREQGVPETMSRFYGMITNIDENVGQLRKTLDELELTDNTLLIFMTDNGTAAGDSARRQDGGTGRWTGFNAGMRGKKGSQFDGGHRVPCFLSCPNLGLSEGKSNRLAAHIDLLPSLIDWCELSPPVGVRFDGRSIDPIIKGTDDDWVDRIVFVHSQRIDHPQKLRKCAVMTERWRLIDGEQLFDMSSDPGQQTDIASEHPEVVSELLEAYDGWWESVSTRFGEYVRIDIGNPEAEPQTLITSHDWHPVSGGVPWNHGHIRNNLIANGIWEIRVVEPGDYRFTLRVRPPGIESSLSSKEGLARIKIGSKEVRAEFDADAEEAVLELNLPAGNTQMQSWLTTDDDKTRGAYYVVVEKLDSADQQPQAFQFNQNDRIAMVGGTFIERMQIHNYFESYILSALPELNLSFRNLGWSGDDVTGIARAVFGSQEDGYQRLLVDLGKANPTVVMIAYGGNESFAGTEGLPNFLAGYRRLIDDVEKMGARVILVTPHRLECLGAPLPSMDDVNALRKQYGVAIKELASERDLYVVDFYEPLLGQQFDEFGRPIIRDRLTDNGMHFNAYGYWRIGPELANRMGVHLPNWEVSIDIADNNISCEGGRVTGFARTPNVVEFRTIDKRLPYSSAPDDAPRGGRMMAQHDVIRVNGLRDGRYGLQIDGNPTILATAEQWRDGVYVTRSSYLDEADAVRLAVAKRNELFFHHHRPQNETYLFLFRKHEQGNNAGEVEQFVPLISEQDQSIQELLRPSAHTYQIVRIADE